LQRKEPGRNLSAGRIAAKIPGINGANKMETGALTVCISDSIFRFFGVLFFNFLANQISNPGYTTVSGISLLKNKSPNCEIQFARLQFSASKSSGLFDNPNFAARANPQRHD